MKALIDLLLLAILIICVWCGYKKGLVMGIGGIIAIIISLYGAALLSSTFSYEVVPALRPFASGYTQHIVAEEVIPAMGWSDSEYSVDDILADDPALMHDFSEQCFQSLGIHQSAAEDLADEAVEYANANAVTPMDAVSEVICLKACYCAGFALGFVIILIILTVIGNLTNLSFKIPNRDKLNDTGGLVCGFVTGIMFCAAIVWVLRFTGILIPQETVGGTLIARMFLKHNFVSWFAGI